MVESKEIIDEFDDLGFTLENPQVIQKLCTFYLFNFWSLSINVCSSNLWCKEKKAAKIYLKKIKKRPYNILKFLRNDTV